jgi:hypothetical protein
MSAFWTGDRDRSAKSESAAVAVSRVRGWRLTAVDRCDRCGAQAYVRVLLPRRLELLFCAHHHRQYASALANIAVEIQDETIRLAFSALSGLVSRGRDRHCWQPAAQIPASGITALGSCHGYLAANRALGQGCLILVVGR